MTAHNAATLSCPSLTCNSSPAHAATLSAYYKSDSWLAAWLPNKACSCCSLKLLCVLDI
jgi:hypothetical protein